jgi:hypothetical protein
VTTKKSSVGDILLVVGAAVFLFISVTWPIWLGVVIIHFALKFW